MSRRIRIYIENFNEANVCTDNAATAFVVEDGHPIGADKFIDTIVRLNDKLNVKTNTQTKIIHAEH